MHALTVTASASTVTASTGWKWAAVGFGLGALVIVYVIAALVESSWSPIQVFKDIIAGADGPSSTSKFQWLVWLLAIVFAYVVIWVLRAQSGDYSAISDIPTNVMVVLGFSTGTMVIAKGLRSNSAAAGKTPQVAPNAESATLSQGLFGDDTSTPDLSKIQMLTFTFIAVGIFLATLINQVTSTDVSTALPDIDSSLLVLMGLSQGGYLGKKLVTSGTPAFYPIPSGTVRPGFSVGIQGFALGVAQGASTFLLDGVPTPTTNWSGTAISFTVPYRRPDDTPWPPGSTTSKISAVIDGLPTNEVSLTVVMPQLTPVPGGPLRPASEVTIQGFNLGAAGAGSVLEMDQQPILVTNWTDTLVTFDVPQTRPDGTPWAAGVTATQLNAMVTTQSSNTITLQVQGP